MGKGMEEGVGRGCVGGEDFHGVMGGTPVWCLPLRGGEADTTSRQAGVEVNGQAGLARKG